MGAPSKKSFDGSDAGTYAFEPVGPLELKGLPGPRTLYAVMPPSATR